MQLIALPWISRSGLMGMLELTGAEPGKVYEELEGRMVELVNIWMEQRRNPALPLVLTAHASVQGAVFGAERCVMLGSDLVLPGSLVRDPRLSYVALGHIHKPQNLNPDRQPPVIYPGSIERVDFGEIDDDKYFVIADIEPGKDTKVEWRKLPGRRFIDCRARLVSAEEIQAGLLASLPPEEELEGAIVRLVIEYPVEWEQLINEAELRKKAESCFEFHLVRRPQREVRLRLPNDVTISSLTPLDLLETYWRSLEHDDEESQELQSMAREIISAVTGGGV